MIAYRVLIYRQRVIALLVVVCDVGGISVLVRDGTTVLEVIP